MTAGDDMRDNDCAVIRELVVWYPTRALDAGERRRVEEHSARCAACADLLRFATELKEVSLERYAPHTDPALLVAFAEDPTGLDAASRDAVERHLSVCRECREQAEMLREVERETASDGLDAFVRPDERSSSVGSRTGLRVLWDLLGATLLRPVPAAIYMVLAIIATVLLVMQPGERMDIRDGRPGVGPDGGMFPGRIGGVVILGDESGRARAPGDQVTEETVLDRGEPHFLVLELTELESPPLAEDTYTVEFVDEKSGERVMATTGRGESFQENYTLGVLLEKGALPAGRYAVRVLNPQGKIVFRSSFDSR